MKVILDLSELIMSLEDYVKDMQSFNLNFFLH